MATEIEEVVQRKFNYCVIDEVDSILIDEARTPLIISGQAEDNTELYKKINEIVPLLNEQIGEETPDGKGVIEVIGDFTKDEKSNTILLTENGHEKAEKILSKNGLLSLGASLYDASNITLIHHVYAALRAHVLFFKDQHYVVQNNEVVIVDEFTGRLMTGRRWSDGLHQAVEAKENVKIQNENQTLASITFQNYFRMYNKLSGMTGTADTEAYEFQEIYSLETVVIPPNKESRRTDKQDQVFKNAQSKYSALMIDIKDCFSRGQPVLVGTTSIENSELISNFLKKEKIPHNVLNAKQHQREAEIIAQAGRPKMITIATNMAGRGTDIVLGGSVERQIQIIVSNNSLSKQEKNIQSKKLEDEWQSLHDHVVQSGGLHIIGTERHESRRIDNQLRGRSGRQGDPGSSRFYLSLDDPLLRIFAGDRVRAIMEKLNMPDDEPIEAGIVSRSIESAQRKVEARNFDIRKQLLEYDDVSNDQRKVIYNQRNEILESNDFSEISFSLRSGFIRDTFFHFLPKDSLEEQWDLSGFQNIIKNQWNLDLQISEIFDSNQDLTQELLLENIIDKVEAIYNKKVNIVGKESFCNFERGVMLQSMDAHWREHLSALDHLRQGIHLRGYAQKNPKQEYKREAFELFGYMLDRIKSEVVQTILSVRIQSKEEIDEVERNISNTSIENVNYQHEEMKNNFSNERREKNEIKNSSKPISRPFPKVGRNEQCPCGSKKKFKHCHGMLV